MHQAVDVFTHFESKVLKSIWLILRKPGFITRENLRGVRVPYAKPVQLFIIVNLIFYFVINYLHRSDYTPSAYDMHSSFVSDRPLMTWARPFDSSFASRLDTLRERKFRNYRPVVSNNISLKAYREKYPDSISTAPAPGNKAVFFFPAYDQKISLLSKTLIFLLIPIIAILFYLAFYKRLRYYGAALIFATHFMCFNLLFYTIIQLLNFLPYKWSHLTSLYALPAKAIQSVFYNSYTNDFSSVVFGVYEGFEAVHIIFWSIWLFIALKRLFNLHWWHNLLASYLLSRISFLLIFSLYKKFLIAFTLWNM